MSTIPPRPEDVMSGGGTFSSCLDRAIRHPVVSAPTNDDDHDGVGSRHQQRYPQQPSTPGGRTSLADAISRSTSSDFANQDAGNVNSGYGAVEVEGGGEENENENQNANANDDDDDDLLTSSDRRGVEDWTSHHISYPLLRSTLHFFSSRRARLRSALRDTLENEPIVLSLNAASVVSTSVPCGGNAGIGGGGGDDSVEKPKLSEEDFNAAVNDHAVHAPFLTKGDANAEGRGGGGNGGGVDGDGNGTGIMEYAGQRALGRTPPGGKARARAQKRDGGSNNNNGNTADGGNAANNNNNNNNNGRDLSVADVLLSSACAVPMGADGATRLPDACSPYLRMGPGGGRPSLLDESEIAGRLGFMERSELSALLDVEVERAARFYRSRIAELAPPRVDGGTCPTFGGCGELLGGGTGAEDDAGTEATADEAQTLASRLGVSDSDELVAPSQERESLSFTEMASEILELHAFITTNVIVVRQVLIKYDAFARSLGGTPMGSWYQTTRHQRVKGRSSDLRDLVYHSKLRKLTKAYVHEYKKNSEEAVIDGAMAEGMDGDPYSLGSGNKKKKRRRRLRGLSRAFYTIVDAGEEMKKRQRLKWRQSAMHLDDDDDVGGNGGVPSTPQSPGREQLTPDGGGGPEFPETPLPETPSTPFMQTPSSRKRMETPPPDPPMMPPDYSNLRSNPDVGEDIAYQVHIFKCIQSKTQRSIEKTYDGRISGMYDNFISTIREYFLLGSATDNLSLMPEYLVMRGKSLKSSLLVVAQWREARNAHRLGLSPGGRGNGSSGGDGEQWFGGFCGEPQPQAASCSSFKSNLALSLNIFACFLYMMNYYIVEPSSTRYANALGTGDAMSGLIIGAMPWAAMISAVLYSYWSNKQYKAPMITSGLLLTAGNLIYASAYRQESIAMALCGRFLTGLGGPRSMNRRYIADTTPLARRTAVNAAFGTATAMGAALGPATAIMLDRLDTVFDVPLYGTVYFNGMTGPGFLMGGLWILFTIVIALTFEEPERSGLREQMRKEVSETEDPPQRTRGLPPRSEYEMSNLDASTKPVQNRGFSTPGKQKSTAVEREGFFENRVLDSFGCPTEGGREICDTSVDCGSLPRGGIMSFDDDDLPRDDHDRRGVSCWKQTQFICKQITLPVRICMFLLFSKMFTVESVISAGSMVTKNRYGWAVQQVGMLGTIVGCLTIPISIFIGWVSQYREDRVLMIWLMSFAAIGMGLLIDVTDFVSTETVTYNEGHPLAVGPYRYIAGYLLVFCSVQAFDGVVGSVLSKVIPTALASGTLNSGLLATIIGTFGRACGDVFITSVGYIDLRQIMNLLFVPSFVILVSDLVLICYNYDSLSA